MIKNQKDNNMADTIERKKYHPMRWVKKTKSQDEWKKQLKIMIKKLEFNIHKSNFWRILSCLLCSLHFGCYKYQKKMEDKGKRNHWFAQSTCSESNQ